VADSSKSILPAELLDKISRLAGKHGVRTVRLFGSAARGSAGPSSDLDLLVQMEDDRSLLDLIAFQQELEEALGRKVDVLSEGGLSPYLKDRILDEAVPL
jgi:predicted nucleotidyltransferase